MERVKCEPSAGTVEKCLHVFLREVFIVRPIKDWMNGNKEALEYLRTCGIPWVEKKFNRSDRELEELRKSPLLMLRGDQVEALRAYAPGHTLCECAAFCGLNMSYTYKLMVECGIKFGTRKLKNEIKEAKPKQPKRAWGSWKALSDECVKARIAYSRNHTLAECAKAWGVTVAAVNKFKHKYVRNQA